MASLKQIDYNSLLRKNVFQFERGTVYEKSFLKNYERFILRIMRINHRQKKDSQNMMQEKSYSKRKTLLL